eukprot:g28976.t1
MCWCEDNRKDSTEESFRLVWEALCLRPPMHADGVRKDVQKLLESACLGLRFKPRGPSYKEDRDVSERGQARLERSRGPPGIGQAQCLEVRERRAGQEFARLPQRGFVACCYAQMFQLAGRGSSGPRASGHRFAQSPRLAVLALTTSEQNRSPSCSCRLLSGRTSLSCVDDSSTMISAIPHGGLGCLWDLIFETVAMSLRSAVGLAATLTELITVDTTHALLWQGQVVQFRKIWQMKKLTTFQFVKIWQEGKLT